jgi:phosphoribosylformylglycinamidine cyclo-ligase
MYSGEDYDLAGFCVGVVERGRMITGDSVRPGDALIGVGSSGVHSNGFSLARKVVATSGARLDSMLGERTLGEHLLAPTRIYVRPVLALLGEVEVRAMAHITGGGLPENLPRVLPRGTAAELRSSSWTRPVIFDWLQEQGNIQQQEMYRTFNCGLGMVICVPSAQASRAIEFLQQHGEEAWLVGQVIEGEGEVNLLP